ncbi:GNAT family N-acetyltransferase [Rubellimicrobium sp. CFH 75288]|uniref:GNAT family N-acetyltransferase n=1 Tax=Rubellimicrobium sp. CFH 75288 TaxID=2697034 RepID=UPI0014120F38|nr:GNAT family N-acetyltransferase [Rubellimicrobium sp. CFH 75288]NAZ37963.1 GNAT family N-acetyltransferase [Rubellimicrobium sp. CFH 75288]
MIETERLLLRRPAPGDWPAFRSFMLSGRAAGFGSHGHEGRAFRAFAAELGHWEIFGYGMWAVVPKGQDGAVALVGPWTPPDWPEPEVGWMILDPAWEGRGAAFEAATAAVAHAYGTLGWSTVVSYIAEGNARSEGLARRLGAVPDPGAPAPEASGRRLVVWRHPRPEERR